MTVEFSLRILKLAKSYYFQTATFTLLFSFIFLVRNFSLLQTPNFYAEDATVLYQGVYSSNPISNFLSPFNGYLITGLYLLAYIGAGLNEVFGGGIETLPLATAGVSAIFFGLCAVLPFALFRKELGNGFSIFIGLLLALVPMYSYDYAILGTLSNLKFAFLYIAFMLAFYRYLHRGTLSKRRLFIVDALLMLCLLTNVTVAFMLPALFLFEFSRFRLLGKKMFKHYDVLSLIGLCSLGLAYVAVALMKGIPQIPGYLDAPYKLQATIPIFERSTTYSLLYPLNDILNVYSAAFLLGILTIWLGYLFWKQQDRPIIFLACWSILLGTVLFVINRPGISDFYLDFGHKGGPDQFFYAQNMVFIVMMAFLLKRRFDIMLSKRAFATVSLIALYIMLALPLGTSFRNNDLIYRNIGDINSNLSKACNEYADKDQVIVQVYVSAYWQWTLDKDLACRH